MSSIVYDFSDIHKRMFGPNKKGSDEDFLKHRIMEILPPPSEPVAMIAPEWRPDWKYGLLIKE